MQRIPSFIAGALFGGSVVFVLRPPIDREAAHGLLAAPPPPLPRAAAYVRGSVLPPPPAVVLPAGSVPAVPPGPLWVPVAGIKLSQLIDTYSERRSGGRLHDAIDIMAPAGTPVLAVDDGRVVKLFSSVAGGLTLYQFDPGSRFVYYYAHLLGYAPDIAEGRPLRRGELIGYVGASGNASTLAPHLHFAVSLLGPERQWWKGTAINPYPLFVDAP